MSTVLLALALACGSRATPAPAALARLEPVVLEARPEGPTALPLSAYTIRDDGLQIAVLKESEGAALASGDGASVHYTGWLLDGIVFDSSVPRGAPFDFQVGGGQVIKGWDQGVIGMRPGERRQLVIPSALGYGAKGAGSIPPGATLVFEVELLAIAAARRPPPAPRPIPEEAWIPRADGARVADAPPCSGAPLRDGERVRVEYTAWTLGGKVGDSTFSRTAPETVLVGGSALVPGVMRTLSDMSRDCTRTVELPSELAFGSTGSGAIPPYAPTIWQITVLPD
jgi:peptidylprolyl isomerase